MLRFVILVEVKVDSVVETVAFRVPVEVETVVSSFVVFEVIVVCVLVISEFDVVKPAVGTDVALVSLKLVVFAAEVVILLMFVTNVVEKVVEFKVVDCVVIKVVFKLLEVDVCGEVSNVEKTVVFEIRVVNVEFIGIVGPVERLVDAVEVTLKTLVNKTVVDATVLDDVRGKIVVETVVRLETNVIGLFDVLIRLASLVEIKVGD